MGSLYSAMRNFYRLAEDPEIELIGFSDGSLSGDYTNGGYGWVVAVKESEGSKMRILAGGGRSCNCIACYECATQYY